MRSWLKLMRPSNWLKNLMLLFPPFLGGTLLQPGIFQQAILPVVSFCLASSATYIINDLIDLEKDAVHPKKKLRPLPAGLISRKIAGALAVVLVVLALWGGTVVSIRFLSILVIYLLVSVSYSVKLKQYPIIDLFCISAGFLLRLQAGGEAFSVVISEWLFLSVFLLALFLSIGKRICEKRVLVGDAGCHRSVLDEYPEGFLEGALYMTGSVVLVTYVMYVLSHSYSIYTVLLCTFGLLRYMMLAKSGSYGDPTEALIKDKILFLVGFMWVVMIFYSRYIL